MSSPRILVISSSTRPGRIGPAVATWLAAAIEADGRFAVDLADLAELNLPLMDEPNHPRQRRYVHDHTKAWSARVDAADAFFVVTPEYNHSFPASIKNAVDYLHHEWANKPVAFASYAGVSGGLRAVTALKPVFTALRAMPIPEGVVIPNVFAQLSGGVFTPSGPNLEGLGLALDELARWTQALRVLRTGVAQTA